MSTSLLVLGGLVIIAIGGTYLFRLFTGRHTSFDGGVVSQSWLMEHRAGTKEDRFS